MTSDLGAEDLDASTIFALQLHGLEGVFVKRINGQSLSLKFTVIIAFMSLLIGFLIILFGYQLYNQQNIEEYSERGAALVRATAEVVDWDRMSHYAKTLEKDDEYYRTLDEMRTLARSGGVEYLYVLYPYDDRGAVYIYDTDESEESYDLGDYVDWESEFESNTAALLRGEEVDPFISNSEWGWLLSIYVPFYNSSGEFAGYLGVDYSADTLMAEQNRYIGQLALVAVVVAVAVTIIFLLILRRLVLKPINEIAKAAGEYLIEDIQDKEDASNSITKLNIKTNDELKTLDESLKYMDSTIKEYIENLEYATRRAETDSMTGLLNRESFKEYVSLVLNQEPKTTNAFMMIDLDEFKPINDTYGHLIGDEVIEACVSAIRKMFRSTDLVARMGGDEFAVFCRGPITRENVEKRAQHLGETISAIRVHDEIAFTVSIGVVYFDASDVPSYQSLYMQADIALYEAKGHGRNTYIINDYATEPDSPQAD